jgi:flagellar protein FliO/FliZ
LVFALWLQPLLLGWSQAALAATAQEAPPEIFGSGYVLQVLASLLLVFACLFGLLFLLRKLNGMPAASRRAIHVMGSVKVGSREKVILIRAGEQHLLVGVAAGSVRTLHAFDGPVEGLVEGGATFASLLGATSPQAGGQ